MGPTGCCVAIRRRGGGAGGGAACRVTGRGGGASGGAAGRGGPQVTSRAAGDGAACRVAGTRGYPPPVILLLCRGGRVCRKHYSRGIIIKGVCMDPAGGEQTGLGRMPGDRRERLGRREACMGSDGAGDERRAGPPAAETGRA